MKWILEKLFFQKSIKGSSILAGKSSDCYMENTWDTAERDGNRFIWRFSMVDFVRRDNRFYFRRMEEKGKLSESNLKYIYAGGVVFPDSGNEIPIPGFHSKGWL